MNELSLTPSELLHAYMDGELDSVMEATLFTALHDNMDLRTEMRELLALRNAVKRDRAVLVPPLTATAGVFSALGITSPYVFGSGAFFGGLFGRFVLPFLVSVTGATLAWFGLHNLNSTQTNYTVTPATSQQITQHPVQPKHDNNQTISSGLPQHANESRQGKSITEQPAQPKTITKYVQVPVEKIVYRDKVVYRDKIVYKDNIVYKEKPTAPDRINPTNEIENHTPEAQPVAPTVTAYYNTTMPGQTTDKPVVIPNAKPLPAVQQLPVNGTTEIAAIKTDAEMLAAVSQENYLWRVQFRGLSGNSLVSINKHPEGGIGFNNMAIGLLYQVAENHYVGMEAGAEPFALSMKGTYNTLAATYELHPSLFAFSAVYQGRFDAGSSVFPFTQLSVGGTEYGPLAKGIFGVQYMPLPHLGLIGGFEYSQLWYSFQSVQHKTPKVGFTYGLSYHF